MTSSRSGDDDGPPNPPPPSDSDQPDEPPPNDDDVPEPSDDVDVPSSSSSGIYGLNEDPGFNLFRGVGFTGTSGGFDGQPATGEAAEIEQQAARNARARSRAKRLAEVADSRARLQANAYTGKQGAFTRHWDIMTVRKYRRPTMMEALTDYNKKNRRGS